MIFGSSPKLQTLMASLLNKTAPENDLKYADQNIRYHIENNYGDKNHDQPESENWRKIIHTVYSAVKHEINHQI